MHAIPPRWREPLRYHAPRLRDRPARAAANARRSSAALVLGILEHLDIASLGHYTESAEALYYFAHALRRAEFETGMLNDPETFEVPTDVWLSPDYHAQLADCCAAARRGST